MDNHIKGLGGVFIVSDDKEALARWYRDVLGINLEDWGIAFPVKDLQTNTGDAYQVFSIFKNDTPYLAPSRQPFMLNFNVQDLEGFLAKLAEKGVEQMGAMETSEFGKFAWIMDPEGRKIELWEMNQ